MENIIDRTNLFLDKIMWAIPLFGVAGGVLIGDKISAFADLSILCFSLMTFTGAISMNYKDFIPIIKKPKPLFVFLLITHVFVLIVAKYTSQLFFSNHSIVLGYILLFSGPVGVVSFMWTSIYKGNTPLSLTIVLLDSLLSPIIVPIAIFLFSKSNIAVDFSLLGKSLLFMVVIPLFLGVALNGITKGWTGKHMSKPLKPVGKILLLATLVLSVSKISNSIITSIQNNPQIYIFSEIIILFSFLFAFFYLKFFHYSFEDIKTISISCGMRNTAAMLVLATTYFEPIAGIPIISVIVFQQINCGLVGKILFQPKLLGKRPA